MVSVKDRQILWACYDTTWNRREIDQLFNKLKKHENVDGALDVIDSDYNFFTGDRLKL